MSQKIAFGSIEVGSVFKNTQTWNKLPLLNTLSLDLIVTRFLKLYLVQLWWYPYLKNTQTRNKLSLLNTLSLDLIITKS